MPKPYLLRLSKPKTLEAFVPLLLRVSIRNSHLLDTRGRQLLHRMQIAPLKTSPLHAIVSFKVVLCSNPDCGAEMEKEAGKYKNCPRNDAYYCIKTAKLIIGKNTSSSVDTRLKGRSKQRRRRIDPSITASLSGDLKSRGYKPFIVEKIDISLSSQDLRHVLS